MERKKYPLGKHPNSRNGFKKGRIVSDEERKRMSEISKSLGLKPPSRLGTKASPETKAKMKASHAKRDCSLSEESKKKISAAHKGKKLTDKQRLAYQAYWEARKGMKPWNYGTKKDREKNPYPPEFSKQLKTLIRQRDNNRCLICKSPKSLCVHHINYNKNDCRPENLITLCNSCHVKTNFKRPLWSVFHGVPEKPTKYNLSLANLSDRLSITTLKSIRIDGYKDQYEEEAKNIMHDLDLVAKEKEVYFDKYGEFIRATQILALINCMIWDNESKARNGEEQDLKLLKLTHSLNRVRNEAMNKISQILGETQDMKSDYMDGKFTKQFGLDFSKIFEGN